MLARSRAIRLLLLGADRHARRAASCARTDPLGVTAEFNKNVLRRLNRERGATFDLDCFEPARCGMPRRRGREHLVSTSARSCAWTATTVAFTAGESIVTEHC